MSLALILILLVTVVLMLLGVEIFVCLGIGAILFSLTSGAMPLENLGLVAFTGLDVFPLLALPLYILTGDLISEGGISKILVDFAKATVGWIRGGACPYDLVGCRRFFRHQWIQCRHGRCHGEDHGSGT